MKQSKKINLDDLPHVSRGTPAGDWFRRHWLVVGTSAELRDVPQAVKVLGDGWTAVTKDNALSAHFEHTVIVTEDG